MKGLSNIVRPPKSILTSWRVERSISLDTQRYSL